MLAIGHRTAATFTSDKQFTAQRLQTCKTHTQQSFVVFTDGCLWINLKEEQPLRSQSLNRHLRDACATCALTRGQICRIADLTKTLCVMASFGVDLLEAICFAYQAAHWLPWQTVTSRWLSLLCQASSFNLSLLCEPARMRKPILPPLSQGGGDTALLRSQRDAATLRAHEKITPSRRGVGRLMATLRCDRWAVGYCRSLASKNPGC